ncbi:MAG TPA: hypothetical protein VLH94_01770 [Spirochaetia bacterium]|nr:hypothetical protein [Spirochaetia bacterium]
MTKKYLTIIFLSVLFTLLSSQKVSAENYGLSIYPPLLRIHIKPGKSITQVFKIENLSSTDKTLITSIIPFSESDNFGNPILDPKTITPWLSYFSLANSQIKFNEPFNIAAGASEQLVLSISIPEDALLTDIYATIIISTYENSLTQSFQGSSIRATLGSNLLITINDQAYPDTILKIENFYPLDNNYLKVGNLYFVDSITPIKFTALVSNEGNFSAETKGVFRVSTSNNKPIYLDGVLPVNVIAKSRRAILSIDGNNFEYTPSLSNIGPHQITLEIKTDNSNTSTTIEVFFFPLKLSLGLFLTLLIIVSVLVITSKSSRKSIDTQ